MDRTAGRADEVLAQLDLAAEDHTFPDLNHPYVYAGGSRTTSTCS